MQYIPIEKLYLRHYRVRFLSCMEQEWDNKKYWNCIGNPKKEHLFLFFLHGSAIYTHPGGRVLTASLGDLIYTPKNSEYLVQFLDEKKTIQTIAVRFQLYDETGHETALSPQPAVFPANDAVKLMLREIHAMSLQSRHIPTNYDCLLYSILNELGEGKNRTVIGQHHFTLIIDSKKSGLYECTSGRGFKHRRARS